jgi:hypothetical protein
MLLITTNTFKNYVYEINNQTMLDDSMETMFHEVFVGEEPTPFTVMNHNEVMLLHDNINLEYEVMNNTGRLHYALREKNTDGTRSRFQTELHEIEIPNTIEVISKYPFDDEHLLLYGENAVWTMKWDGTELQRIFPVVE